MVNLVPSEPVVLTLEILLIEDDEDDYILTVLARDLADFERIHKEQLSRLPGVVRLRSSFVLREVASRQLPTSSL